MILNGKHIVFFLPFYSGVYSAICKNGETFVQNYRYYVQSADKRIGPKRETIIRESVDANWTTAQNTCHSKGQYWSLADLSDKQIPNVIAILADSCFDHTHFWIQSYGTFRVKYEQQLCPVLGPGGSKYHNNCEITKPRKNKRFKPDTGFGFICERNIGIGYDLSSAAKGNDVEPKYIRSESCDIKCGEHAICAKRSCTCRDGFSGDGFSCFDVDECLIGLHWCSDTEECENTLGSFDCRPINFCDEGFEWNAFDLVCEDIDECATTCDEFGQVCENTPGSFICECAKGYQLDQSSCGDINECLDPVVDHCGKNSDCINSLGSFDCECNEGYIMDNNKCKWQLINECDLGTNDCHKDAKCTDLRDGFQCQCNPGYMGPGTDCDDQNECVLSSTLCSDKNSKCVNTIGSFDCECVIGFTTGNDPAALCSDIDECQEKQAFCQKNSKCKNTIGSYTCMCNSGYELNEVDQNCNDINECDSRSCHQFGTCINTIGSYKCECISGYTGNGMECTKILVNECVTGQHNCEQVCIDEVEQFTCDCFPGYLISGVDCVDIDECQMSSPCNENQECFNAVGSFSCRCNDGYRPVDNFGRPSSDGSTDGFQCEDINECDGDGVCHVLSENCKNTAGSFYCECKLGYKSSPDASADVCLDIDECSSPSPTCEYNEDCINNLGSFVCECKDGFLREADTCVDINECNTIGCGVNEDCHNTDGDFKCVCSSGFEKIGLECQDVDECTRKDICGLNELCQNYNGSYECFCRLGFETIDQTCVDINECALFQSGDVGTLTECAVNATCTNEPGSYECFCLKGFLGNGFICDDIDECVDNPCLNSNCVNTIGSYNCVCHIGYEKKSQVDDMCDDVDECSISSQLCQTGFEPNKCVNSEGSYTCDCSPGYQLLKVNIGSFCVDTNECDGGVHNCSSNGICSNREGTFSCACPDNYLGDGFRCEKKDAPYEIEIVGIADIQPTIDICNFGLVKFKVQIAETFGRQVTELCFSVISSDDEARTDPEVIYNVLPGIDYEVTLLADLTDLSERPYIHICPCGQRCQDHQTAIFITLIDDECNSASSVDFKDSITASYSEKRNYAQTKMKFTVENEEELSRTGEIVLQNCYEEYKDRGLISCKILNQAEIAPTGSNRYRRGRSSKSMTVGATFKNKSAADDSGEHVGQMASAVANQVVGSVIPMMSLSQGLGPFITQLCILIVCTAAAIAATVMKIMYWKDKILDDKEAPKDLAFAITMDYIWPILGVYPSIVVWFEYKVNEKLFTDPLDDIASCMIYVSVTKLYLYLITLFFMDQVYRETDFIKRYPILNDIFLDYNIVSFIMCDSIDTFIVYFYSSRYQAPEKEVGLSNFWLPTFQFLMSFIPAAISLTQTVTAYVKGEVQEEDQVQWWIKFISEFVGAFGTILSALMFVCCTAITICTKAENAIDPRLNRVLANGTVVKKDNQFTQAVSELGSQNFFFCKGLDPDWFSDVRFDSQCARIEPDINGFKTKPQPFGKMENNRCYNPLEVSALGFIIATMCFQLIMLLLFIFNYYLRGTKTTRINRPNQGPNLIRQKCQRRNRIMSRLSKRSVRY